MVEFATPEGDSFSKLLQVIKRTGYNKAVDIEIGTVIAAPPNILVKLDSSPVELDKDDLVIAEHLTNHKRAISIRRSADRPTKISFGSTDVSESISPASDITAIKMNDVQADFTFEQAEIEYLDELKAGDRVICAWLDEQMRAVIIDRARWY